MNEDLYNNRRVRQALAHFFTGRLLQAALSALLLLWVVRLLTVDDYGAYVSIIGLVELLVPLASFGLLEGVQRFVPQVAAAGNRHELRQVVVRLCMARLLTLLIVMVIFLWQWEQFARLISFSEKHILATTYAPLLILFTLGFRFLAEILEACLEQGRSQYLRAGEPVYKVIGIGVFLFAGNDMNLQSYLFIEIGVSVILLLSAAISLHRLLSSIGHETGTESAVKAGEIFSFCWHMTAVAISRAATSEGALRLVVSNVLGLQAVASFGFLQRLQSLIARYLPSMLLRNLVRPVLISRYLRGHDFNELSYPTSFLLKINWLLIGTIICGIVGVVDELLLFLSGGKFAEMGAVFIVMLAGVAINSNRLLVEMVMQLVNLTRQLRLLSILGAFALVVCYAIARYGLLPLVMTVSIYAAIWNSLTMRVVKIQGFNYASDWRGLSVLVLASCLASLLAWAGRMSGVELVLLPPLGGLSFLGFVWYMKPFRREEIESLGSIVGKRINFIFRPVTK
jgi:O-antigen/teichoic acid export membrane protein